MIENDVERYLRLRCREAGAECEKFVSPGKVGVPDRIVTWWLGRIDFIETKRPKGPYRSSQDRDHRRRINRGCSVYRIDSKEKVDLYIDGKLEPVK